MRTDSSPKEASDEKNENERVKDRLPRGDGVVEALQTTSQAPVEEAEDAAVEVIISNGISR